MLWKTIENLPGCRVVTPTKDSRLFLFQAAEDATGWLVGPYQELRSLATALRNDAQLRQFMTANRVRLGLRESDVPPAELERKERFGPTIQGVNYNQGFAAARFRSLAPPVQDLPSLPINRRTDREENVRRFWEAQTPQSHHIVEFNNLETLGVSHAVGVSEMDYLQLPAVLLAAEFHQRYISAILKRAHHWNKARLQNEMTPLYRGLYRDRGQLFTPLWRISRVILTAAGLPA
jgi:hypothetical protein